VFFKKAAAWRMFSLGEFNKVWNALFEVSKFMRWAWATSLSSGVFEKISSTDNLSKDPESSWGSFNYYIQPASATLAVNTSEGVL